MKIKTVSLLLLISISFLLYTPVLSKPMNAGSGPSYLVQPGDSLSSIASRFGLTLQELMDANPTIDPNTLAIGDQVLIPGLEGIEGLLITDSVQFGDSLTSLSRRNQIQPEYLIKLNHITSPSELFAGLGVVLPQKENFKPLSNRLAFPSESSLLEAAVLNETTVYDIVSINQLGGSWQALPSDVLYDDKVNEDNPQSALPFSLEKLIISPIPMTQGGTVKIFVQPKGDAAITGMLVDKPLHFFPDGTGQLVAIQGVHAMLDTGPYPLRIVSTKPDGTVEAFEQMVIVQSGNYPADPILNVDPATIDPAATEPEIELITGLVSQVTDQKLWSGLFLSPSYFNDCFTSRYGNRRTYVGVGTDQSFDSFHSGLDFCGGTGLPITAPANGVIVFSGPLTVRGNATIIDHGWGIFSGIWHQDSTVVTAGQSVKQGELIGYVGGTGRVTGAHLHWEIWANGVQVNPMEWLENQYP